MSNVLKKEDKNLSQYEKNPIYQEFINGLLELEESRCNGYRCLKQAPSKIDKELLLSFINSIDFEETDLSLIVEMRNALLRDLVNYTKKYPLKTAAIENKNLRVGMKMAKRFIRFVAIPSCALAVFAGLTLVTGPIALCFTAFILLGGVAGGDLTYALECYFKKLTHKQKTLLLLLFDALIEKQNSNEEFEKTIQSIVEFDLHYHAKDGIHTQILQKN